MHKGDLLLDYTKAIKGHIGRDLKGEILSIKPIKSHQIRNDSSIVALEDSTHIKFCARKDGFLKEIAPFILLLMMN
ncbi:FapA family protein [Helicobacter canadensis]|uniref:FapA family protein n=1 Tax=Helicobacter canadensis TaxID=123841 RepID=UPI00215D9557|nr:FapA family protein [Helicobacter canadensis]